MILQLLIVVAMAGFCCPALDTPQEPDLLILEGQRIYTSSLPSLEEALPDITFPEFTMISTANYKGYRATWATFQKQLYLVGLEGRVEGNDDLLRNHDLVPEHSFPIKVTGWSGEIVQTNRSSSLDGETRKWTDIEKTTTITVEKGMVTDTSVAVTRKPRD